jgi:small subunit ribosomal protein S16
MLCFAAAVMRVSGPWLAGTRVACRELVWFAELCRPVPLPRDTNRTTGLKGIFTVVMIRLARVGARKQPYYRVVVIEKDRARNGRSIEVVGTYNPRTSPASVNLKHERIAYWRGVGAQFSPTVAKLVEKFPASAPAAEPTAA